MSAARRHAVDRFLVALDRRILGTFFRQIEVVGAESVPPEGPVLVVANHGNSLVDPMLVFGFLPRPSRFLAKSTLWRHPVAKHLVRLAAAIPVYRRKDSGVDTSKNAETFARSHEELAAGGVIALFPEGISHNEPALAPLKTGVARIALGAERRFGPLGIAIVPVGLNFEDAERFRSRVLLRVGEPIRVESPSTLVPSAGGGVPLPPCGAGDGGDQPDREEVRALTGQVEEALRGVTLNYDSWRQAELVDCAAQVYSRGEVEAPSRQSMSEQFALKKGFLAGFRRIEAEAPDEVRGVLAATEAYDGLLREVGLEDRHVAATYPRTLVTRFVLRHLWSLTLWRPLSLVGVVLNWLPYRIPGWVTRLARVPTEVRATWKVLISMVLFPLFWSAEAVAVGWRFGWPWGLATLILAPLTGWFALTYSESWKALRDESAAFLKLRGRRAAAKELARRRHEVSTEIERLVELHRERFATRDPAAG